jgi:hypothetical protein
MRYRTYRWAAAALLLIVLVAGLGGSCSSSPPNGSDGVITGAAVMPDSTLTPGAVASTDINEICASGYARRARDVSTSTKNAVYAEYHIATHRTGEYEIDHLVPLGIGGANDIKNLWPQPTDPRPGRLEKDTLEDELHRRICDHRVDVRTAQHDVAADWAAAYRKYVLHR